jgi:hypothetical protein
MVPLAALLALAALADEPMIPVGVARVDITPKAPVRLTGYVLRQVESEGVAQRIYARAVAIGGEPQGGPVVLVTVETCAVNGDWTERIAARLKEKAGLPRERFVLAVTHTHTAPALTNVLPFIFNAEVPPDHQARIDAYTRELADKVERAALAALADRRPGRLAWGAGTVGFANNRRTVEDGKWVGFGVNPGAPVDHTLPVLRATDWSGNVRALVLGYACHCTALDGHDNKVCGDWAGYASHAVERDFPGAVGLVVIGCAGDSNPKLRGSFPEARADGEAAARETARLVRGPLSPLGGPVACRFRRVGLPFAPPPTRDEWQEKANRPGAVGLHARANLARLDRGEALPKEVNLPVQSWCFGEALAVVFLGGEVVVDYALRLRREWRADRLWVVAYSNDVPCYIPSRRVLAEGGYEVERSMASYDRPGRFAPEVEDLLLGAVRSVVPPAFENPVRRPEAGAKRGG